MSSSTKSFVTIPYEQIVPLLVNEDYDFTTQYGPNEIQSMLRAPDVQQVTFSDTYVGLYFLAPPDSGLDTVPDLVASGMSYEDAFKQAVGQMVGKRVAIDDTGSARAFVDAVFEAGGVTPDDFAELLTVDDARMLLLARGGQIDFGKPLGGAQNAELIQDGWYPILGAADLIELLPPGDPRGATGIGHTGLGARASHYAEDPDTFLRVAGVMFRVVDAIKKDVAEGTDVALANILPVLESAAAVEIGIDGLRIIYGQIDPMKSFEEQEEYWGSESKPLPLQERLPAPDRSCPGGRYLAGRPGHRPGLGIRSSRGDLRHPRGTARSVRLDGVSGGGTRRWICGVGRSSR